MPEVECVKSSLSISNNAQDELETARMQIKREKHQASEEDREGTISGDKIEATASRPVKRRSQPGLDSVVIDLLS